MSLDFDLDRAEQEFNLTNNGSPNFENLTPYLQILTFSFFLIERSINIYSNCVFSFFPYNIGNDLSSEKIVNMQMTIQGEGGI